MRAYLSARPWPWPLEAIIEQLAPRETPALSATNEASTIGATDVITVPSLNDEALWAHRRRLSNNMPPTQTIAVSA